MCYTDSKLFVKKTADIERRFLAVESERTLLFAEVYGTPSLSVCAPT